MVSKGIGCKDRASVHHARSDPFLIPKLKIFIQVKAFFDTKIQNFNPLNLFSDMSIQQYENFFWELLEYLQTKQHEIEEFLAKDTKVGGSQIPMTTYISLQNEIDQLKGFCETLESKELNDHAHYVGAFEGDLEYLQSKIDKIETDKDELFGEIVELQNKLPNPDTDHTSLLNITEHGK